MTRRKNDKSKVGEIFVYFKTGELLLVRWQLQGDDGTVSDSNWTSLSHADFSWIEMTLAINPLALNVPHCNNHKERECVLQESLVVFYVQKVTWNAILFSFSVVGSEQLLLFKENKAVP